MMKMKNKISGNTQKGIVRQAAPCFLYFLVYLVMLLGVLNRSPGFTDESDNFIGGMVVASGGRMYRDFVSQHMPLMYYICAVLKWLGADSVYEFRLYFYVLLAAMWTFVAVYYKKRLGAVTSVGTGVFYITNLFTFYTCCILAEQIQSICFVVLFMEFLLFAEQKRIDKGSCIMISGAVFLSFGTAFVSAFPIFAIALAFFIVEIQECCRKKYRLTECVKEIWKTFRWAIVAVLTPFAVLLLVYAAEGTLSVFIYSAYTVNREIYPNYIAGYGSSIVMSFVEPVINYVTAVADGFRQLVTEFGVSKEYLAIVRYVICYAVNMIFWVYYAKRKNILQAVMIAYFTMMCGTRGFTHEFHSLPYVAVTMFMSAYLIGQYVKYGRNCVLQIHCIGKEKTEKSESHQRKIQKMWYAGAIVIGMTVCVYGVQYIGACRSILLTGQNLGYAQKEDTNNIAYWINTLTDDRETVLLTTIEPQILVEADRIPFRTGISAPWMYEAFAEEEISNLEESAPRIAIYSPDYQLWGYSLTDYAPDFVAYMSRNYTPLDEEKFPELYIRNDYLNTAKTVYDQ